MQLTITTLLSLLITATAQYTTGFEANCTVFNWDNSKPYLTTYAPQRVSGASSCAENKNNHTCALTASGDAQYSSTANISSLSVEYFASVVSETVINDTLVAPGFNATVIGSIDATRILRAGQAGYLNFTAYKFCYTGTVGNCTKGVEDGAGVDICAPVWHWEGDDLQFDGEYTVVNVSAGDVSQYGDPYANQSEGGALGLMGRMNGGLAVLVGLVVLMVV